MENKYQPIKIPERESVNKKNEWAVLPKREAPICEIEFAEIVIGENESVPVNIAPKPQAIEPIRDERKLLFLEMRQIIREHPSLRLDHSKAFYKQAVFMKDYEDNYELSTPFSVYYPYYQLMSYEQLRTYFTWRKKVRNGIVDSASVAYAFVYIYELLNNIGTKNPQDGLDKLMAFHKAFREYDTIIDKYIYKWIKDYHVFYDLKKSFSEFVRDNNLKEFYPKNYGFNPDKESCLDLYNKISKYNIKSSVFYNEDNSQLINDCFYFVISRLKELFSKADIDFNDLIFKTGGEFVWAPFSDALFYFNGDIKDKTVEISENEQYSYSNGKWLCKTVMINNSGRQLLGYIIRQTECALRKITKFKHKLSADIDKLDSSIFKILYNAQIPLEKAINKFVLDYYTELNKVIVTVDTGNLMKIRSEAMSTQEKLILTEPEEKPAPIKVEAHVDVLKTENKWEFLKKSLIEIEIQALKIILRDGDIKEFCRKSNIMPEVLIDSINQKAYDVIEDNIMDYDGSITVYYEYIEKLNNLY